MSMEANHQSHAVSPEPPSSTAAVNADRRPIIRRHPVVTFLLAPGPTLLIAWMLFVLIAMLLFRAAPAVLGGEFDIRGKVAAEWPLMMVRLAEILHGASRFVPPALVALLFWRLAARNGLSWRWSLAACLVIAILAGTYNTRMQLPTEVGQGSLSIGFGVSKSPNLIQCLQLAVPAIIGGLSVWRLSSVGRLSR